MTRQANALLVILVSFLLSFWLRFGYTALPENYLIALLVTLLLSSMVAGCKDNDDHTLRDAAPECFLKIRHQSDAGWHVAGLFPT